MTYFEFDELDDSEQWEAVEGLQYTIAALQREIERWRAGPVDEEMLRRHDGCIRVGKGCEIAIEGTTDQLKASEERAEQYLQRLHETSARNGADTE